MTSAGSPSPRTLRLPARSRAVPTTSRVTTRRAPALAIPLLAVALGGGVVVAAQATGSWSTTGRDAAAGTGRSTGTGSSDGGTGASVDRTAGPATPADVKGWMTLRQVLDASFPGVTEAGLRTEFAIPETFSLDSALKDLDGVSTGFDMAALREWLAAPG